MGTHVINVLLTEKYLVTGKISQLLISVEEALKLEEEDKPR